MGTIGETVPGSAESNMSDAGQPNVGIKLSLSDNGSDS